MDGYGDVVRRLGRGIYGTVDLHKLNDGTLVAVKKVNNELDQSSCREIHCLQKLKGCPYIINLLGVILKMYNTDIILPHMSMDMSNYVKNTGSYLLRISNYPSVYKQMVSALHYLKMNSIMHLDIKPQNILIQDNSGSIHCYLADFGISNQLECKKPRKIHNYDYAYSPQYRPPEVIVRNGYTFTADVWAMGVTLLEYVTGQELVPNWKIPLQDIFANLTVPLPINDHTMDMMVHHQLRDSINVQRLTNGLLTEIATRNLTLMLQINPYDRKIEEMDLVIPNQEKMPDIGHIVTDINLYNGITKWVIDVCDSLNVSIRGCLCSLDLLARYSSHYSITPAITAACISLASDMIDGKGVSLYDLNSSITTGMDSIVIAKIDVLKGMNYMLYSCEIDNIALYIDLMTISRDEKYNLLFSLRQLLSDAVETLRSFKYDRLISIIKDDILHE